MVLVALIGFAYFFAFSQFVLLPLYLEPFGLSPGQIGVMLSWTFLSSMLVRPFMGTVLSLLGPRWLAILSCVIWILTAPAFMLLTEETMWLIYPLRILQGIGVAGIDMVVMVVPQQLSPPEQRAKGLGLVSIFFVIGWSISPVVAEWLLSWTDFRAIFMVSTLFGFMALAASLMLRLPAADTPGQPAGVNLFGNWKRTFNRNLALLFAASFIGIGFPLAAYDGFIPLYAKSLGIGAGSVFFLFRSITSVAARALFSGLSDKVGRRIVVAPAFLLGIAVQVILFRLGSATMLAIAGLIQGLQSGLQLPALMAYAYDTQEEKGNPALGIGLFFMAFDGGFWVGTSLFGFVAERIGFGPAYLSLALCVLVAMGLIAMVAESSPTSHPVEKPVPDHTP